MNNKSFSFEVKDDEFKTSMGWCGNRPQCVAVAIKAEGVAVRDTKSGSTLFFDKDEWSAFVNGVRSGEFSV